MRIPLALLLLAAPLLAGDDEDLPPDETEDLVQLYVERGEESLRQGEYEEARLRFGKAVQRDPKSRGARLGVARAWRAVGALDKAEAEIRALLEALPGDREARVAMADLDLRRGRDASAREALQAVAGGEGAESDNVGLRARFLLAEALAVAGRRDEARTQLDPLLDLYEREVDSFQDALGRKEELLDDPAKGRPVAERMTLFAKAMRLYVELSPLDNDHLSPANLLLGYAREIDPTGWEALVEWVRVRRFQRQDAEAKARTALEIAERTNPEIADLYVEAARAILPNFNEGEARRLAETALKIDPSHTGARAIVARVCLEDNEYGKADEHLDEGLTVNPRDRELLSLRATHRLLQGDAAGFEAGMKEVLAVDPGFGEGFHLAGLVVASRQRRYDRAVALVRRALEIDPMNVDAHATLGIFLANIGQEEEARAALAKSRELFPYPHPVRENFKDVLDYVRGTMTELRTERFVYRFDPSEYEVLSQFLPPLMEECYADLTKRYGFEPKLPILVQIFKRADDFSVRTLGLPGIPALGACFGGLITLDSPQALPPGRFQWASTARHEFAHVISLQLSEGQVPRWFTEGMSVLEEMPLDTGWGMDPSMEMRMFDEWTSASLPAIGTFDAMFRTPDVGYAYYVGGWMLRFLRERAGEAALVKALRVWSKDRPMEEVFREAFGLELKNFDALFHEYVGQRVSAYRLQPDYARSLANLKARAAKHPDDGVTLLRIAFGHFSRNEFVDAGAYLERARRNLPPDDPDPKLLDAYLSLQAGRKERGRALLEEFFSLGGEGFAPRVRLAELLAGPGEEDRAAEMWKAAKRCFPVVAEGRSNPYSRLAAYYKERGMLEEALREKEEQSRVLPTHIPLRLELAQLYLERSRNADAVRVLEEALRVNLFDVRIHRILLPLYREGGEKEKALRAARCAVALLDEKTPDSVAADYWLDLCREHLEGGRREEARAALEEAKRRSEEAPRVAEYEERLRNP